MRRSILLAAALAALSPVRAGADSLEAGHAGTLRETRHTVQVAAHDRLARFTVTRQIRNDGDRVDEAQLSIDLPAGAVATRLRVRADGRWHEGALLEAKEARARYDELTTEGELGRRGPALLSWSYDGVLELAVFPVASGEQVTIQYELLAPVCYVAGLHVVDYVTGREDPWLLPPSIRAAGAGARVVAAGELDAMLGDVSVEECAERGAEPERRFVVFPAPRTAGPVQAVFARYEVDDQTSLMRLAVEVAPVLEPAPRAARVVFVLDASASMGEDGIAAQLALARGYLAHVPDARVEIVAYRRRAARLFGAWVGAGELDAALAALGPRELSPGNGSHLERGLALAVEVLAGGGGPARIVAFTDSRLRDGFTEALAAAAVRGASPGTVLHIAHLGGGDGDATLSRADDDEGALARLAASVGGGMKVTLSGRARAAAAMLELVRPLRIDRFRVEVEGLDEAPWMPATMPEGMGYGWMELAPGVGEAVVLSGMIWGRPLRIRVPIDPVLGRALPALALGHDVWRQLDPAQLLRVARDGQVVSPVTSLLADPGAPPSSYDYEDGFGSISGISLGRTFSTRCGLTSRLVGVGHAGVAVEPPDRAALLRRLLAPGAAACALQHDAGGAPLSVRFETTGVEIVDVAVRDAPSAAMAACVADAAWELGLDDRFDQWHAAYDVTLRPARLR